MNREERFSKNQMKTKKYVGEYKDGKFDYDKWISASNKNVR